MEKSNQLEASSPLATVEEIQKRLARPPPLRSQSSSSFAVSSHRRLEYYLHPVLLSAARAETGRKRRETAKAATKKIETAEFEWFEEMRNFTGGLNLEKKRRRERNGVVDLNCDRDSDYICGGGGGGGNGEDTSNEEEDQLDCTPFQRFEKTALKRFNGE